MCRSSGFIRAALGVAAWHINGPRSDILVPGLCALRDLLAIVLVALASGEWERHWAWA